jgi:diguanylate cyclase (GGDEF)-like protein
MRIDVTTLFIIFAMNCAVVGVMFLAAWTRSRNPISLRAGAAAFLLGGGISLVLLRADLPHWASITLANSLILSGLGLAWSSARVFDGRTAPAVWTFAGAGLWLALQAVPAIADVTAGRLFYTSLVSSAYALACAIEFSRPRAEPLKTRTPIAVLLYIHAAILALRGLHVLLVPPTNIFEARGLLGVLLAEPAVMVLALSLLGVGLVREHSESSLRRTAATDELTGVLNRRALLADAREAIARARRAGLPTALLLFDLDHFKSINDRFGHSAGDRTLLAFARLASHAIRQSDIFGRLGGEEFAAVLPGSDARMARFIAERIRAEFSRTVVAPDASPPTVSIGIAARSASDVEVEVLLVEADHALYEAKRGGRDQVVDALALAS